MVSVIVPVWNDRGRLANCIEALSRQNYPREKLQIIVVDNGSIDQPEQLSSRFPGVEFLKEDRPGSYQARNLGIQHARGEILGFTDADCVPAGSWVSNAVSRIAELNPAGLLAGAVKVVSKDLHHPNLPEMYEMTLAYAQDEFVKRAHFGATCNMFTNRTTFEMVGLFDADLNSGSDSEWGRRVFAAGHPVVYAEEILVSHPARRSVGELVHRARRVAGGMVRMERHRPWRLGYDQLKELLPLPSFLGRILRSNEIPGRWNRVQLVSLMMVLRYIRFGERLRVLLGGQPLR